VIERISRFVDQPGGDSFAELALAAFSYQYERVEPYRRLCAARGASPASVDDWRRVPLVPAAAFKRLRLAAAPEREIFRSSGTSGGEGSRSVHYHPFPELYRKVVEASFPPFCLPGGAPLPMLSLIPTREQLPDSSLSFMVDHVVARYGSPASATACGRRGVEAAAARSWTGARQREGQPVLILATALALAQWLEALERQDLRFRLPPGSAVFETGGFKGRHSEVSRDALLDRLSERLGVLPSAVVREYGMTELTSQCYTRALLDGDPDLFVAPHWMRVRILDPETLAELPPGKVGLIALFDLANVGSAVHLLTEDLGIGEAGETGETREIGEIGEVGEVKGFRFVGRAAGAELRGCSLAAEELELRGAGAAASAATS
jgi:hypothetical protein